MLLQSLPHAQLAIRQAARRRLRSRALGACMWSDCRGLGILNELDSGICSSCSCFATMLCVKAPKVLEELESACKLRASFKP